MPPNNTTRQARIVTVEDFTTVSLDFFSEKLLALQNVIGVHNADGQYRKDCMHLEEGKEHHHKRISVGKRDAFFLQEEMEAPLASQHANTLLRITLRTDSSSDTERKLSVKYLGGGWLEEPSSSLHSPTRSSPQRLQRHGNHANWI
jgi:cobyrinic acid a,c-diamide synthase